MKPISTITIAIFSVSSQLYAADNVLVFSAIDYIDTQSPTVKVLEHAYQKLGIEIKFRSLQGNRGIALSNKGILDGEVLRSKSIEGNFPNLIRIDFPMDSAQLHFFVKQGNEFKVDGWGSIPNGYSLGYPDGLKIIQTAISKHHLDGEKSNNLTGMFKKLDAGRTDVAVASVERWELIDHMGLEDITVLEPPIETHFLYHYLHKSHADLVPEITTTLKKMWESGEFDRIWDMYNHH